MMKFSPRFMVPFLALSCVVPASLVHAQDDESGGKKPKRAPQSAVAAKGAFPTIKASDPVVKKALLATNLAGAKKLVGKNSLVVGTVEKVYVPKSNKLVLLNFAKDYKKALVGVVKSDDFSKFPVLTSLKGKKVLLDGKIVLYKEVPQIELTKVGAIKLVK